MHRHAYYRGSLGRLMRSCVKPQDVMIATLDISLPLKRALANCLCFRTEMQIVNVTQETSSKHRNGRRRSLSLHVTTLASALATAIPTSKPWHRAWPVPLPAATATRPAARR
jgi:hypothetical protein